MPEIDNEPPFSRGKCVEGLVTSISNLSKSDTNLQQMQDPTRGLMSMEGRIHFDLQSFSISTGLSETSAIVFPILYPP